jgi:aromatic ring-opening dioxygenase catalytic subunit (LigB family)
MPSQCQPTIYLSHGGGPCFWMDFPPPFGPGAFDPLRAYLTGLIPSLAAPPRAILMISAHWEATVPTVGSAAAPPMLFDYYGFPDYTYRLSYPAPGSPALAAKVQNLLTKAGIPNAADPARGFDHGVFVPMLMIDPTAALPVVTLSLQRGLDPAQHLAIGSALAPLRQEGVLILGSGNSYHNLESFFDGNDDAASQLFDDWLQAAATHPDPATRAALLTQWKTAPAARICHPRAEHLLPLMVVAGAAGPDLGHCSFRDAPGGKTISGFTFGQSGRN